MLDQDKILSFLQTAGPSIPSKVAKIISTDILFASAHLSDLASQKKVKISSLKIGGTPLYYLPGQEEKLYHFAQGNINPKDFAVLELLKNEKVLREQDLELLPRVALRSLKDFALPFNVTLNNQTELFWQFYLISEEERNQLVQQILHKDTTPLANIIPSSPVLPEEPPKIIEPTPPEPQPEHPLLEKKQPKEKPHKKRIPITDTFIEDIEDHFKKLKIIIEQKETIRKNAELNLIVKVPSSIGQMKYYCKAKNKQRCDEKDLSSAYMEAQIKKLPLLFLYTNEIHKKAQEMLESGAFENAIIKKIE
ncbi:hypothetical protein HYX11_03125 [Candidatus Woesearchaeota archaeon]|nr:hypothetical protein [Candidatus Woesearchaeota archaeon]